MYRIEAHWEVGKRGRPAHAFYVNGKPAGTTAKGVAKLIQGPSRKHVYDACDYAKTYGPIELRLGVLGWQSRSPT